MKLLAVLSCFVVVGCGKLNGDDAGTSDAGADATGDVASDSVTVTDASPDTGVCSPNPPALPQNENCDQTLNDVCKQWAETAAVGAYGDSICIINNANTRMCAPPDCNGWCCGGGPVCLQGQVCASLTPNGPHQCVQACSGL